MITYSVPLLAGTPPTYATPSSSDTAQVGSVLIVKNGSGASITVTMVTPGNLPTGSVLVTVAVRLPSERPMAMCRSALLAQAADAQLQASRQCIPA